MTQVCNDGIICSVL